MHTLKLYKDRQGKWRWRLIAENRKIVADSGQGYTRKIDCRRMAEAILDGTLRYTVIEGDE